MLMVLVMHMRVGVLHLLMHMLVLMVLGQVKPHADAHEQAGDGELQRDWLA